MFKKLTLMALSVAALVAFAIPAAAQAENPLITDSLGGAAGTIEAHSGNTTTQTANGKLECATVNLDINLSENTNLKAHGSGSGSAEGTPGKTMTGHCGVSGVLPVHILSITVDTINLTKHGGQTTGTANFTYTYLITHPSLGEIHCTFTGTGVTVTATGEDTITVAGEVKKSGGSAFCAETGQLAGEFTVTDEFGSPAVIH
jgi:hypothetical protein